ncbi:SRPBCC domain-containing protein [Myxococcus sp. K15C18031901]|uniref:SRPBCC family protein n=1 Tax=Myxococcus dinghuensis TaxID=2906761 RepID=UPI0020A75585|nr:SRPBCC domain-containing protein [Myxococcus dinghuensis]MCP3104350.1 SRPBCC domain-containing protein [Myxococcus dinghuensis]
MSPPPIQVQLRRHFAAAAERVFDAWLDPAMLRQWMMGPSVRDEVVLRVAVDARVGGTFSFFVRRGDLELDHVGTYLELSRPRRLVFTWAVQVGAAPLAAEDLSQVTLDFEARDNGCVLTLTHTMDVKWAEYARRTEAGWTTMLGGLDRVLSSEVPHG